MKKLFIFLMLGLFLISFTSALDPHTKETNYKLTADSNNATTCNFTYIKFPDNTQTFFNLIMAKNGINFYTEIEGSNYSQLGITCMGITCTDGVTFKPGTKCIEVTPSGRLVNISGIIANALLIFFFASFIFFFHYIAGKINYEKWHNSIIKKYEYRNYIKVVISSIGYNILKNKFIWYYLFGLPLMLLITDMAFTFGVNSMVNLMQILLAIYYWGFILVGAFFFGYLQEWVANIVDEIKSRDLGV